MQTTGTLSLAGFIRAAHSGASCLALIATLLMTTVLGYLFYCSRTIC